MPAPIFIAGSFATLLLFVLAAAWTGAPLWSTLLASLGVWLLLQLGYVAYVAVLVAAERRRRGRAARGEAGREVPGEARREAGEPARGPGRG